MDVKTGVRVFTKVTLLCLIVGGEGGGLIIKWGTGGYDFYISVFTGNG